MPGAGTPTVIRGVKLVAGSTVFYLSTRASIQVVQYALPIKIESREVAATNGESFAFARKSFRSRTSGAWSWVENPDEYYVTRVEAEEALANECAKLPDLYDEVAVTTLEQAQKLIESSRRLRAKAHAMRVDAIEGRPACASVSPVDRTVTCDKHDSTDPRGLVHGTHSGMRWDAR